MSEQDKNKDGSGFSGDEMNERNFGTPENYFDSFSSRLFSKIRADEELKEYPLLGAMEKVNPFAVPAGYFEAKEELLEFTVLRELKQKSFLVPANYFETLSGRVMNKLEVEAELAEYASLAAVEKGNVFAVPDAYFENFYGSVKEIVAPAKVVPLYGRVLRSYKFVAAAAVALLLTFVIIMINQKTEVQPLNECNSFACLSKKDILNSGALDNISEESIIEMLDMDVLSDSLTIKQNGVEGKISAEEISNAIDVSTLTEEL